MEKQKSFLETWKEVVYRLKDEGLITQEEINQGFEIPIQWLYTSGMERIDVITAIRNLYHKEHPNSIYLIDRFKRLASVAFYENEGVPSIEVTAGKNSIFITEEKVESKGWKRNVTIQDFIEELMYAKKQGNINRLIVECGIPREQATAAINLLNEKQIQSDLYAMPQVLSEIPENFEEYYKYMQKEKEIRAKEDGPAEIRGGIIEQEVAELDVQREHRGGHAIERQSDIYPFEQRDQIFRNLKPETIVTYDGIDKNREIVRNAYTLYIYKKPQEHDGYLGISEHLSGDKETRVFYVPKKNIEDIQENEDMNRFWSTIGEKYIGMSGAEFSKEEGTYRFRHRGTIDDYKQKIEGVINGVTKESPQATNVKRASLSLFGIKQYNSLISSVTRSRFNKAKQAVFEDREITQTKEGEDLTND